ncbi:MAG TPA: DUF1559 domain-containing protein [Planctomycetaceae bacterium]
MSVNPEPDLDGGSDSPVEKQSLIGCGTVLTMMGIGAVLVALMLPSVQRGREVPRRSQCRNNLRQIARALLSYEYQHHALPPAYTVDVDGKPLHSWRTLILPYLDHAPLYNSIDLSKPWDDPANEAAFNTHVAVFDCPSDSGLRDPTTSSGPRNYTTYLASVGPNACFRLTEPRLLSEITDGTPNTLMLIEVASDQAVPWMSPQDADEAMIMSIPAHPKLTHTGGTHAALCDGSVQFLSNAMPAATRRALISIAGKDTVGDF